MEIKKMRRRARQWNKARAMEGTPKKGHRPFGWRDDRVTLDPVESELLRKAVRRLLAGASVNSIVRDWQRAGVLTPRGNLWKNQTLRVTLRNARLCGWRTINGDSCTGEVIGTLRLDHREHTYLRKRGPTSPTSGAVWYSKTDEDRLDMSQKRAYVREALRAVRTYAIPPPRRH
ncbi:recombinase family protein [Actinomadura xylanilytica]|nr:recombinase family protein [Actinomadura xylanilytica]MDL4773275.1 recombinase family protein [Actinomadura xylanilytica]